MRLDTAGRIVPHRLENRTSQPEVESPGAAIVTSFLGAQALSGGAKGDLLTVLALIAFGCALGLSMAILWPRKNWRWAIGAKTLLEDWADDPVCGDVAAMQRFLAEKLESNWDANQRRIDCLYRLFQGAVAALGADVVFWTIKLAERR